MCWVQVASVQLPQTAHREVQMSGIGVGVQVHLSECWVQESSLQPPQTEHKAVQVSGVGVGTSAQVHLAGWVRQLGLVQPSHTGQMLVQGCNWHAARQHASKATSKMAMDNLSFFVMRVPCRPFLIIFGKR